MLSIKEEDKKRIEIVFDRNYTQLFLYFVRLLKRTRLPYLKYNGFFMKVFQINWVKILSKWQDEWRKIKRDIAQEKSEKKKKELKKKLLIYTEWIRIFQTIMDGVAWRNLKFNRPLIRLFSENSSPGHINKKDVKLACKYLSSMSNFVIYNDLTRCLRIADFTRILPNGKTFLYEMKKSGNVLKDLGFILKEMRKHKRPPSSQELKQCVAQSAIIDGKIIVPRYKDGKFKEEFKAEIIDLDFPIQTHIPTIKKLIKKADKNGYAQIKLGKGYFIGISAYDEMAKSSSLASQLEYRKKQFKEYTPKWLKDKKVRTITFSNYESFLQDRGHYTRNLLPYSIIPLPARDCVRLMMGSLHLIIYYNLDALKEEIEKSGWIVRDKERHNLKKDLTKFKKGVEEPSNFFAYELDETLYYISKKEGSITYYATVLYTEVIIMLSSMYKTKFLIDNINFRLLKARKHGFNKRATTTNFLHEKKILI